MTEANNSGSHTCASKTKYPAPDTSGQNKFNPQGDKGANGCGDETRSDSLLCNHCYLLYSIARLAKLEI